MQNKLSTLRDSLRKIGISLSVERDDDGTIVVNCSAGRWINFCNAIEKSEAAK